MSGDMTIRRGLIMFALGLLAPSIVALSFTGLMLLVVAIGGGEELNCTKASVLGASK